MPNETHGSKTTKIVFLDIDGPLVTRRAHEVKGIKGSSTRTGDKFDPLCVGLLNLICEKSGAKIVISSSWRSGNDLCKQRLVEAGVKQDNFHATDWETPDLVVKGPGGVYLAKRRGDEISEWMLRHGEPEAYVILDDDADMLGHQLSNFVQVTFEDGILFKHYEKCLERLGASK